MSTFSALHGVGHFLSDCVLSMIAYVPCYASITYCYSLAHGRKMACCRCYRTGRCQNCSCVKRGQPCPSCLPQRLGNCVNTVQTRSSTLAAADISLEPPPAEPNSSPPTPVLCRAALQPMLESGTVQLTPG